MDLGENVEKSSPELSSKFSYLADDIKKIVVGLAIDSFLMPGIRNYEKIEHECKQKPYLNIYFCDNFDFWANLWLKYVSSKVPKTTNTQELKLKYKKAMELYNTKIYVSIKSIWGYSKQGRNLFSELIDKAESLGYDKMAIILKESNKVAYEYKPGNFSYGVLENSMKKGADPNLFPEAVHSVLFNLLFKKDIQSVKYLMERGLDIDASSMINDETILQMVVNDQYLNNNLLDIIKNAIELGANVNRQDENGLTIVNKLVKNKIKTEYQFRVLQILMDAGTDLSIPDKEGKIPMQNLDNYKKYKKENMILILNGTKKYNEIYEFNRHGSILPFEKRNY